MPNVSWTAPDVALHETLAQLQELEAGNSDNVVSCMSAFEDEVRAEEMSCSESSSGEYDHVNQPKDVPDELHQERRRLLVERRAARRQCKMLKMQAKSLVELIQDAYDERQRIVLAAREIGGIPNGLQQQQLKAIISSSPQDSSTTMTHQKIASGNYYSQHHSSYSSGSTSSASTLQRLASGNYYTQQQSSTSGHLSSSQPNTYDMLGSPSTLATSDEDGDMTVTTHLKNSLQQPLEACGHAQVHSSLTPKLSLQLGAYSPSSASSIASLSTRSCSQATSSSNPYSYRSCSSFVSSLQATIEGQEPWSHSTSSFASTDMASTRAKLAELEEQIKQAKSQAAAARSISPSSVCFSERASKLFVQNLPQCDIGSKLSTSRQLKSKHDVAGKSPAKFQSNSPIHEEYYSMASKGPTAFVPYATTTNVKDARTATPPCTRSASRPDCGTVRGSRITSPPRRSLGSFGHLVDDGMLKASRVTSPPPPCGVMDTGTNRWRTPRKTAPPSMGASVAAQDRQPTTPQRTRPISNSPRINKKNHSSSIHRHGLSCFSQTERDLSAQRRSNETSAHFQSGTQQHLHSSHASTRSSSCPCISPRRSSLSSAASSSLVRNPSPPRSPSPPQSPSPPRSPSRPRSPSLPRSPSRPWTPSRPRSLSRAQSSQNDHWKRRGVDGASSPPRKAATMEPGCVRVVCRVRPLFTSGDASYGQLSGSRAVRVNKDSTLEIRNATDEVIKCFSMDEAFGEQIASRDVFVALQYLVQKAARGGNAAVLAYGPSGGGKTHTMYGDVNDLGLVPRAAAQLLAFSAGKPVSVSMLELHNNMLVDLLVPRGTGISTPLEIRGGSRGTMATIEGAREIVGTSLVKMLDIIHVGLGRRQVATTKVNSTSSRSHLLVKFKIDTGQLMFMDLAGIERVKRSGAEGSILREAQNINQSLQSVSDVVEALRRGASHIPVRNTQLARLVSGPLSGAAETAVVVCVSPSVDTSDEALTALCFAERVRRIPAASCASLLSPEGVK